MFDFMEVVNSLKNLPWGGAGGRGGLATETVMLQKMDFFFGKGPDSSTDFEKQIFVIDLIANAFRALIQNTSLLFIFFFIFCSIIYLFQKTEGGLFLLALKG